MTDWKKEIGQFSRDHSVADTEKSIDKELRQQALSGHYGYEQTTGHTKRENKSKIYQSYDQQYSVDETTPALPEEIPNSDKNEVRDNYDSYDAISLHDDNSNHMTPCDPHKSDDLTTQQSPLNKRIVGELIICILAFVGRGLCLNSLGPTMIDLRQIAKMTITQSAWIFISQSIGFLIGSVVAKALLQRFNNELLLGSCLILQAVCTAFIPAFRSMTTMCLMFVGQGIAIGVVGIGVCATCIRLGGKTRNGMFLQSVYLGVSVGSVLGPFIARPFLSSLSQTYDNNDVQSADHHLSLFVAGADGLMDDGLVDKSQVPLNQTTPTMFNITNTSTPANNTDLLERFTATNVHFFYIFIGLILCIPAFFFLLFYTKTRGERVKTSDGEPKNSEPLSLSDCTIPLAVAIVLLFTQCLLYFGIQDTYSNLLTTYAVLGPLEMSKTKGVYLASLFWASMCFGRLNGIWIAKLISPFKMLLVDFAAASVAASGLIVFGGRYSAALWGFTLVLGLSFASVNGATVSWAAAHMPENNYVLSIIMIGRCIGLLILPSSVTAMFKIVGPVSLMATVFITILMMLICVLSLQGLASRCGLDGRLHGKRFYAQNNAED